MRSKFSLILDSTILFVTISLLIFAWVRFYTKSIAISLIIGILIGTLVITLTFILYRKRTKHIKIKKEEKSKIEYLALNLPFTTKTNLLDFFKSSLQNNFNVSIQNDFLILKENNSQNSAHNTLHSTIFVPYFDKNKLDMDIISLYIKIAQISKIFSITFCAKDFDDDVKSFVKQVENYDIKLLDLTEFYCNYAKNIQLPQVLDITKPKLTKNELVNYAFSPARARHYLLFGLLIILTSFLVPFKIYYLISGSTLCLTALLVKLIPILKNKH